MHSPLSKPSLLLFELQGVGEGAIGFVIWFAVRGKAGCGPDDGLPTQIEVAKILRRLS